MQSVDPKIIDENVRTALHEDMGTGDVSAALLADNLVWQAHVYANESAILCGRDWFDAAFFSLDKTASIEWFFEDGQSIASGDTLCTIKGKAQALLSAERTALNFLQTLSGTATQTHALVQLLHGTSTRLLDTRKTLPGLRLAQKYAVRCGGGCNHRTGLFDAIMLKENHIQALGSIDQAMTVAKQRFPMTPIIVEVENLSELQQALQNKAQHILLDNFTVEQLEQAVKITHAFYAHASTSRCKLEASGNVSYDTLKSMAATGVDFISMGSLTKHVQAIDFSMRFMPVE